MTTDARPAGSRSSGLLRSAPKLGALFLLAAIVAAALFDAAVWAVKVPFLLEPDESAHADYAFAIYNAGRLIRARDGQPHTDASPQLRFLEAQTGYHRLRYDPDAKVARGYGSPSYFRRIDEAATKQTFAPDGGRVPYVAFSYPFLYYALVATAMHSSALVAPHSLVAQFFAARAFNVVLLGVFLFATYAFWRLERVPAKTALIALAAVAFAPSTAWVFGYVQPDNLAAAELALTFALLAAWKRTNHLSLLIAASATLAALSITKQHYFLVAAVATLLCVLALRTADRMRNRLGLTALLLGPAVLLQPLSLYVTAAKSGLIVLSEHTVTNENAFSPSLGFFANRFVEFVASTYAGGPTFTMFWDTYSWGSLTFYRFPIVSSAATLPILRVGAALGLVVLALWLFREDKLVHRLRHIAVERSLKPVVRLVLADAGVNAYFIFAAVMFGLCLVHPNTDQGRYWLPVSGLTSLILIDRLWLPFGATARRKLGYAAACALAVFSTVAGVSAVADVPQRFYIEPPQRTAPRAFASIERATDAANATNLLRTHRPIAASGRARVTIAGWALDLVAGTPPAKIAVFLDDRPFAVRYPIERPDVARHFHDDSLAPSGFQAYGSLLGSARGTHRIRVLVYGHGYSGHEEIRAMFAPS